MSERPRRVSMVVNPISGRGAARRKAAEVERLLRTAGSEVTLAVTDGPGHAERLSREAAESGADVLVACGGDGTVNEAVQGLARSRAALAVMPMGTANVLARELRLSSKPRDVAEMVLLGRRHPLDLGCCGGTYFACMAGVGFDAFVAQEMNAHRTGPISYVTYVPLTWGAMSRHAYVPLTVRVDGETLRPPVYHVSIGNTRTYGGPFVLTPWARPDDGRLDVCAFGGPGSVWLTLYFAASVAASHHLFHNVRHLTARRIEVDADVPVPVQLDGDFKTHTPAAFEVVPAAITVLQKP